MVLGSTYLETHVMMSDQELCMALNTTNGMEYPFLGTQGNGNTIWLVISRHVEIIENHNQVFVQAVAIGPKQKQKELKYISIDGHKYEVKGERL